MAFTYNSSTVVCDAGPNTVPGPIVIQSILVPTSTTLTIKDANNAVLIATFAAGYYPNVKLADRGAGLTFTGACTLFLVQR